MSNNKITFIRPNTFGNHLKTLNLSGNKLANLDLESIGLADSSSLISLRIQNNRIERLKRSKLNNMLSLRTLIFDGELEEDLADEQCVQRIYKFNGNESDELNKNLIQFVETEEINTKYLFFTDLFIRGMP